MNPALDGPGPGEMRTGDRVADRSLLLVELVPAIEGAIHLGPRRGLRSAIHRLARRVRSRVVHGRLGGYVRLTLFAVSYPKASLGPQ